jgi:DNA-binding LytR/AlgR family response regulator
MKILIIEDEPLVARDLKKLIHHLEPDFEVVKVISSLSGALIWFEEHEEPDLIFMDIQLSDGVSFEIFEKVKLECPVIFTTAYNEYALRAFKVNSVDYLLKPIDPAELQKAITKFKKISGGKGEEVKMQITELLRDLSLGENRKKYKERFIVNYRDMLISVPVNNIAYFKRDELVYLQTMDNKKHISEIQTMEEIEHLIDPELFFRANRQFIIHINTVDNIRKHFNGKLVVKLKPPFNEEIDISRERAGEFKKWLS